jgi:hypothetical protein
MNDLSIIRKKDVIGLTFIEDDSIVELSICSLAQ